MRVRGAWIALVALYVLDVEAQYNPAIVLEFDPSVRDAGMGGATAASFWTNGEASWCNPALLGSVRGLGYDYSHTQLHRFLADDISFRAERFRIGEFGVGASFSGEPSDHLGFARLDYGVSERPQDIDSWAVGADLIQAAESLLNVVHVNSPDLARTFDVSIGYSIKKVHIVIEGIDDAGGPVEVHDRGLLVRFTPYEGGRWFVHRGEMPKHGNLRFDVAYGLGIQNQPDETITFTATSYPIPRFTHHGIALRVSDGISESLHAELRSASFGWLVGPRSEFWSASAAAGHERESYPGANGDRITRAPVEHFGLELELLDLFAFRYGFVDDEWGHYKASFGLSLGLQYRGFAGVRWDYASNRDAHAVVAFVDGIEIARALRH